MEIPSPSKGKGSSEAVKKLQQENDVLKSCMKTGDGFGKFVDMVAGRDLRKGPTAQKMSA